MFLDPETINIFEDKRFQSARLFGLCTHWKDQSTIEFEFQCQEASVLKNKVRILRM